MASLNKVMLIGNLTRDPELRVTPKGTSICQFGLAINREYKDESGAKRDDTTFLDLEAWGKTGELIAKYLSKGSPCFVEGRLKLDQWEDKESGQKRSKIKVVVEQVQFIGAPKGKQDSGQSDESAWHGKPPSNPGIPSGQKSAAEQAAANTEDVPF